MSARKPLVIGSDGLPQQLQAGDTLDAPVSEVDLVSMTNGESGALVIGTPVYVSDADEVKKAKGDAMITSDVLGFVKDATVATTDPASVQTDGVIVATTTQWDAVTGQTGGLTPGARYFLDVATGGKMTVTPSSTTGKVLVVLGTALSSTDFEIAIGDPILL